MNIADVCPPPESWSRLLSEDVPPEIRDKLELHLSGCDSCVKTLTELAGDWSLTKLALDSGSVPLAPETLEMLARVAASPPFGAPRVAAPLVAVDPPEIPGMVGWEVVGEGGMGVVFRAREVVLDRTVAVKVLSLEGRSAPSARARAIREAMLMASLRHPNVVQVYRSGEAGGLPYLVMEWVAGGTLKQRMAASPIPIPQAAAMVRDLARAVAEAHALGIIHRDLKPANVLLDASGAAGFGLVPKLTDFGLARGGEGADVTETGMILGSPGYMAPEQTGMSRSPGEVGPATDIHGLGAILYACLTGQAPYSGQSSWEMLIRSARGACRSVRELRRDTPRDLVTIAEKCLQAAPSRRYRSAGELADDLGLFLEGRPISARPIGTAERGLKWSRRHPALAASAVLLIAATLAGIAGVAYHVASITDSLGKLAAERDRTEAALASATSARDRARVALSSLSDDVVRRMMQRGAALDEADRAFLRKVRDLYANWPMEPEAGTPAAFRADGFARIGIVFETIGRLDDAMDCWEAAISAFEQASGPGVDAEKMETDRLNIMTFLHGCQSRTGRLAQAEATSRKLILGHQARAGRSLVDRCNLAWDLGMLGIDLALQGRTEDAEAAFADSLARWEVQRLAQPTESWIRLGELSSYKNWAIIPFVAGRMDEAEARYRKMEALADAAAAAHPGDPQILGLRIVALDGIIDTIDQARPEEAFEINRKQIELARLQAARTPDDPKMQANLIHAAFHTYRIRASQGRPGEAEADLLEAIDRGNRLVENAPAVFEWARDLVAVLGCHAALLETTGRAREALGPLDRIVAVFEPWAKLEGRSDEVIAAIIDAHRRAGRQWLNLGDGAEAGRRLTKARALASPGARLRLDFAVALERQAAGDLSGARVAARRGVTDAASFLADLAARDKAGEKAAIGLGRPARP